jgi:cytochrome b6-f complex iron-sulfur subunit
MEVAMSDQSPSAEEQQQSRLAPEAMPRRDFLGKSALWSAAAAMFFALVGMLRLPKAAVLPSPSKRFRVTLPESLGEGEPFVPRGRSVALFRDAAGVYAISTICTHLGCVVKVDAEGFHCPCHGSEFNPDGSVMKGPAPKGLPWLAVKTSGEGEYTIDEGSVVAPETRTEA